MSQFTRQHDILTPEQLEGVDVDIVGAGALGGAITVCFCKIGCGIHNQVKVTDFDTCEQHNLPTQWFRESHVVLETPKVEALAEMNELITDRIVGIENGRFTGAEKRRLGPVVVVAIDSLEERGRIWRNIVERSDVDLLIDARMGAEVVEVRTLRPGKEPHTDYEESLANPQEAYRESCTRSAILYTVFGAASLVGSIFRAYVTGGEFPRSVIYDARGFILEAEGMAK